MLLAHPFPLKQEMRRIQINHSQELFPQPLPQELLLIRLPQLFPQPLPPKQERSRIIQIQLQLLPPPKPNKEELLLQPQLHVEQSFIFFPPKEVCYAL